MNNSNATIIFKIKLKVIHYYTKISSVQLVSMTTYICMIELKSPPPWLIFCIMFAILSSIWIQFQITFHQMQLTKKDFKKSFWKKNSEKLFSYGSKVRLLSFIWHSLLFVLTKGDNLHIYHVSTTHPAFITCKDSVLKTMHSHSFKGI